MSSVSNSSSYILSFDTILFIKYIFGLYVPALLFGCICNYVFEYSYYRIDLLLTYFARWRNDFILIPELFEKRAPWLYLSIIILFIVSLCLYFIFSIVVIVNVNNLIGLTILLVGFMIIFLYLAFQRSRGNGFRINNDIIIHVLLISSFLCWLIYSLWVAFSPSEKNYTAISVIFLTFNMLPIIYIAFLITQGEIKNIQLFKGMRRPNVVRPPPKIDASAVSTKSLIKSNRSSHKIKLNVTESKTYDSKSFKNGSGSTTTVISSSTFSINTKTVITPVTQTIVTNQSSSTVVTTQSSSNFHSDPPPPAPPPPAPPLDDVKLDDIKVDEVKIDEVSVKAENPNNEKAVVVSENNNFKFDSYFDHICNEFNSNLVFKCMVYYLFSIAILCIYMILIGAASDSRSAVGVITSVAVILQDMICFLCVLAGRLTHPRTIIIEGVAARLLFIVFGDYFWFIGHSIAYFILMVAFGVAYINLLVPSNEKNAKVKNNYNIILNSIPESANKDSVVELPKNDYKSSKPHLKQFLDIWVFDHAVLYLDFYILSIINFLFVLELILVRYLSSASVFIGNQSSSIYFIGVFSFFCSIIVVGALLTFRFLENNNFIPDQDSSISYAVVTLFVMGFGGYIYAISSSIVIIAIAFFVSPMIVIASFLFSIYVANGYSIIAPPEMRSPCYAPFLLAFWTGYLPLVDYLMLGGLITLGLLDIGLGGTISAYADPQYIGWTISCGLLILATTILPIIEYFQRLEITSSIVYSGCISLATLITTLLIYYYLIIFRDNTLGLGLLFILIMYPTSILGYFTFYYWKDNNWEITDFVKIGLAVSIGLIYTFFGAVAGVYSPWFIGVALMFIFTLFLYICVLYGVWRSNKFYLPDKWRYSVLAIVAITIIFGAFVGVTSVGFSGYSIVWFVFIGCLVALYVQNRNISKLENQPYLWSGGLFPVYHYIPHEKNPLTHELLHPVYVSMFSIMIYMWGSVATWYINPNWVGIGIFSLALIYLFTFALGKQRELSFKVISAIDFLGEGSENYNTIVQNAILNAEKQHIFLSRKVNVNSMKNALAADSDSPLSINTSSPDGTTSFYDLDLLTEEEILNADYEDSDEMFLYEDICDQRDAILAIIPPLNFSVDLPCFPPSNADVKRVELDAEAINSMDSKRGTFSTHVDKYFVEFKGNKWSRRMLLLECLRLQRQYLRLLDRENMYWLSISLNIIRHAEDIRNEEDRLIQKLLISSGFSNANLSEINAMDIHSEERVKLAEKIKEVKIKEDARKEENKRRREEEIKAARERDLEFVKQEVERQRIAMLELEKFDKVSDAERLANEESRKKIEAEKELEIQKKLDAERKSQLDREQKILAAQKVEEETRIAAKELKRLAMEKELAVLRERAEEQRRIDEEETRKYERLQKSMKDEAEKTRLALEAKKLEEEAIKAEAERKEAEKLRLIDEARVKEEQEMIAKLDEAEKVHQRKVFEEAAEKKRLEAEVELKRQQELDEANRIAGQKRLQDEKDIQDKKEREIRIKREQELETKRQAQEKLLNEAVKKSLCTVKVVGSNFALQDAFFCETCNKNVCTVCATFCHKKHCIKINGKVEFLCDCNANASCSSQKTAEELTAIINANIQSGNCTRLNTSKAFVKQKWYECLTCKITKNVGGICESCKNICHDGHNTILGGESRFYCDCLDNCNPNIPGGSCLAVQTKQIRNAVIEKHMKEKELEKIKLQAEIDKKAAEDKAKADEAKRLVDAQKIFAVTSTSSNTGIIGPILDQVKKSGAAKWEDKDFFGPNALHADPKKPKKPKWKEITWKRPEEIPGVKAPVLFDNGLDPDDIKQGQLGDCWFLSAISVMCKKQNVAQGVFVETGSSNYGIYVVKFHKNGKVVEVAVDDRIPCNAAGKPIFASSTASNELWVSIIEKAFAKLHRNYESIESGFTDQALADLTGGIAMRIDFSKDRQLVTSGSLWKTLLQYRDSGYLMGAGSPSGSDSAANASSLGIVQGHAYSLLDVQECDDHKLVKLRNPWGRFEWKGAWGDDDPKWTERMKKKLNLVKADDGVFWMDFMDFTTNFEEVYVCRFFDGGNWITIPQIEDEWKGVTAGGCSNYPTVGNNPQWSIKLNTTTPANIVINLSQEDTRGSNKELSAIGCELYSNKGARVSQRVFGKNIITADYTYSREVTMEGTIEPSPAPYTLLISSYEPGTEGKFTLKIFSTQDITVTKL